VAVVVAIVVVSVVPVDRATQRQLRHSPRAASRKDWDRFEQQEALVPEPWHGTQLGEFFGWQERAAGVGLSRDKERSTLGKRWYSLDTCPSAQCVSTCSLSACPRVPVSGN
jgi:hypothetical protein